MRVRICSLFAAVSAPLLCAALAAGVADPSSGTAVTPRIVGDGSLKAITVTLGGASVLPTTRTVAHWFGQTTDPENGVTYGYNMVGSDPYACTPPACSTTVQVDITPLVVNVGGMRFDGTSVVVPTLASPLFATNDYGSTEAATAAGSPPSSSLVRGTGGVLSQGDRQVPLQLEDATMRAQFNSTGASAYHLLLEPNVLPSVTIDVPSNHGTLLKSAHGVVFADVDVAWWSARITEPRAVRRSAAHPARST